MADFTVDGVGEWSPDRLVACWLEAHRRVLGLAATLSAEQWLAPTPCPGWTVGDVVAHLVDLESISAGDPPRQAQVSLETHPHLNGDFGLMTERGVEARRSDTSEEVLAEFEDVLQRRAAALGGLGLQSEVPGPFGAAPLDRVLRMRTFDAWVHEQDIRLAVGADGGWDGDPAAASAFQMVQALPFIWGKKVAPGPGRAVRLVVTGPGLQVDAAVRTGEDGRAQWVEAGPVDTTLTLGWPSYMRLSCGRSGPIAYDIAGDGPLGERLVAALSIAP